VSSAPASDQSAIRAAYGLRLDGVDGGGYLPAANGEPWPEVRVEFVDTDDAGDWRFGLGGRRACLPLPGGWVRAEREDARMTLRADEPLTEDLLVHPWLSVGAAVFARWHCRDAFHGGAVVGGDGAWAVFAPKEGGKSTLLAWLADRGYGIVCDDLLVVEGDDVYPGPRCVDLRPGTPEALGIGGTRPSRGASRLRLPLKPVAARLPLRGVIYLAWGSELSLERVALSERIDRLRGQNAIGVLPAWESGLLRLAALPTFELRRPRDLAALPASADALIGAIGR
jgi:hypothetical protein